MGKVIKNINFLDLTGATEDNLEEVSMIKNINLLIFSKKISKLLSNISMKNINTSMEVPENIKLKKGNIEFDESYGESLQEPVHLGIKGTLIIKPNVTLETMEKVSGITIFGDIYCPNRLKGAVQNKIDNQIGDVVAYMDEADQVVVNSLQLDNHFLRALDPDTHLVIIDKASVANSLDPKLLQEKVKKIEFIDEVFIHEEILDLIGDRLVKSAKSKMKVIPAGSIYIDDDLMLDSASIKRFDKGKLYVTGTIQMENDITEELLDECIAEIYAEDRVLCSQELLPRVMEKCKDPSVEVMGYKGRLIVVNGEYKLTQAELKYTKETLTFNIRGILDISEDVDPEELYNKIEAVHLYGVINAHGEQSGVIQTKLRTKMGVVSSDEDNDYKEYLDEDQDQNVIANMNYLRL